jgi:hypothetical protein
VLRLRIVHLAAGLAQLLADAFLGTADWKRNPGC